MTPQEEIELQDWMREVDRRAMLLLTVQDELARSPEFGALAGCIAASTGDARRRAVEMVADFAVLFVSERLWRK